MARVTGTEADFERDDFVNERGGYFEPNRIDPRDRRRPQRPGIDVNPPRYPNRLARRMSR
jgi:hypothetical protein